MAGHTGPMVVEPEVVNSKFCFDPGVFGDDTFDATLFIAAAKELSPLEVLRDHLRSYQRDLKEELYSVINRDLADYLDLSSKLSGLESEVLEVRAPLQEVSTNVQEASGFVATTTGRIRSKVCERASLQRRRERLQRRIRFLRTLGTVESMLGLRSGAGQGKGRGPTLRLAEQVEGLVEAPQELEQHCRALERASHAWTSLIDDLPSVLDRGDERQGNGQGGPVLQPEAVKRRLHKLDKALLGHLAAALRVVLCPKTLVIAAGAPEAGADAREPLQVNERALRSVLRSLVVMGRGDEAEKQVGRLMLLPFLDLHFTQGRLDGGSRGSCSGLKGMLSACLAHVRYCLGRALGVAEELVLEMGYGEGPDPKVPVDLVCNGVWKPVQQVLTSRLGAVFVPGIANILHSNYVISSEFLKSMALLAGAAHQQAVQKRLQAHPSTLEFKSRWNLPVYFHLRFSEVSTAVDGALDRATKTAEAGRSASPAGSVGSGRFRTPVVGEVWAALESLWSSEVFLPPLTHRLFRLTLQIIGRFRLWLEDAFECMSQKRGGGVLRPDAPLSLVEFCWDLYLFSREDAVQDLEQRVLAAIQPADTDAAGLKEVVGEGLREAMGPIEDLVERGWEAVVGQLVSQSATTLQAVRGITATYRMTNKRPPERASLFVAKVLDPVRSFEPEARVPPSVAPVWKNKVALAVTERYLEVTREVLSSVDQMEDALKKRRQRTGRPAEGATAGLSDSDKIKLQLLLDAVAFADELSATAGWEPLECDHYTYLLSAVAPALPALTQARDELKAEIPLPPNIEAFLKRVLLQQNVSG